MVIQPIPQVVRGDGPAIADHAGHDPQDHFICDIRFQEGAVISRYDIAVGEHFQDPVEDVFRSAFVKNHVVLFAAARFFFPYFDNILPLTQERHHAVTYIRINNVALRIQQIFKRIGCCLRHT